MIQENAARPNTRIRPSLIVRPVHRQEVLDDGDLGLVRGGKAGGHRIRRPLRLSVTPCGTKYFGSVDLIGAGERACASSLRR